MWHKLPDDIVREKAKTFERKPKIPRLVQTILGTAVFLALLFAIAWLDETMGWRKEKQAQGFSLHNASAIALGLVFIVTVLFMYFLLVKNRKTPVIYVCFDCEEAFHARPTCPVCQGTNVSDIRLAEWKEN